MFGGRKRCSQCRKKILANKFVSDFMYLSSVDCTQDLHISDESPRGFIFSFEKGTYAGLQFGILLASYVARNTGLCHHICLRF